MKLHQRLLSFFAAVCYSLTIMTATATADVRISEFHANPDVPLVGGAIDLALEPFREWIELQNITTETLTIGGLVLTNSNGGQAYTIPAGTVIAPNDRFVICRNTAVLTNGLVSCDAQWTWTNPLPNSNGTISLLSGATVIDSVSYTATSNGVATEVHLDDTQTPATNTYNFTGERGTPGFADDTTAPPTPINVTPDNSFWTTSSLSLIDWTDSIDPSAPVRYVYQSSTSTVTLPGGSFAAPAFTSGLLSDSHIPTGGTPEGVYYWHVRALDNEGNTSPWSSTYTVTIDNTAPTDPSNFTSTPTISTPSNDATVDVFWPAVGAEGGASDNLSGVDGYSVSFSMDPSASADTVKDLEESAIQASSPELTSGMWYFNLRTVDNSGNWSSGITYGPFIIDTVAPIVTVDEKTTSNRSPSLSGTIDDPTAVITVTLDEASYIATNNGDGTWTLDADQISPDLTPGIYDVEVTATDEAGNIGQDQTTDELAITLLPSIGGGTSDLTIGATAAVMPASASLTPPAPSFGFAEPTPITSSVSTTRSTPVLGQESSSSNPGENRAEAMLQASSNNWLWWLLLAVALLATAYALYRQRVAARNA